MNREQLAAQRAYIEGLTEEQRAAFNEYVAAEEKKLYRNAAAVYEMEKAYAAKRVLCLSGSERHEDFVRLHEEHARIHETKHTDACLAVSAALARLNELAPEGHYFDETTGRYVAKYVYPATLPTTGTELVWRHNTDAASYDFWRSATFTAANAPTKLDIAKAFMEHAMLYGDPAWKVTYDGSLDTDVPTPLPASASAAACECGAHKASGAPRGEMHSTWCPWRTA